MRVKIGEIDEAGGGRGLVPNSIANSRLLSCSMRGCETRLTRKDKTISWAVYSDNTMSLSWSLLLML